MPQRTRTAALAATAAALIAVASAACSATKTRLSIPRDPIPAADQIGPVTNQADVAVQDATPPIPAADASAVVTPVLSPTTGALARGARRSSSPPAPANPPATNQGNSWAVLIGISHYQGNTEPTYGGDGDVSTFQALLQQAGWDPSHILVLTDGRATAQGIRYGLRWLVSHSSPGSFTLFHYSGHVCKEGRGPCQGPEKYLWGADNVLLSDIEFGQAMSGLQGWSWIDIAGCEAGAFDQGLSSRQRLFTGSSLASETSYEYPPWHESVWTGMLVDQGMLQRGASQGQGPISVQQAVSWAQQQVASMTSSQSAGVQHPYANGGTGDWFLGSPAPAQQGGQPAPGPPPAPPPPPSTPPTSAPPPRCTVPFGILYC